MACYLRTAGYATYLDGKFLTTWPKTTLPPCFDHSTVMWGGYNNVAVRVDGKARTGSGYNTTYLGNQGRSYITSALSGTKPFLLYETPQAPHWVDITNPNGTTSKLAVPETKYASANVGTCSGVPEADRADKPAYVRTMNFTTAQGQAMCQSQLRAIMTRGRPVRGDHAAALGPRGPRQHPGDLLLRQRLQLGGARPVGEVRAVRAVDPGPAPGSLARPHHCRHRHHQAGLLPRPAADHAARPPGSRLPANAPRLDGESLLQTGRRTTMYSEYYVDVANPNIPSWRMVRTATTKYIQTYNPQGTVIAREYYNLTNDPAENTNLLGDSSTANDPPAATVTNLTNRLNAFATCTGAACVQ